MNGNMKEQREGGFLISKIHQLSQRIFNQILKNNNLDSFNSSQGRIMFVLMRKNNIPIHDLVKETQFTKSTLSSHLDNLEKAGFIKRSPSTKDKRETIIKSTALVNNIKEKSVQASKEMMKIFYKGFNNKEIEIFEALLNRCLNNLINYK
jgi:DNA-binding MarR family transcriptional regulator